MIKKNSLNRTIWLYFIGFSLILLFLIYLFQVSMLPSYYEFVTKKEIIKTSLKVKRIVKNSNNYREELNNLSNETGICIELYNGSTNIFRNDFVHRGCIFSLESNKNDEAVNDKQMPKRTEDIKNNFINTAKDKNRLIIKNDKFNNKTILYGVKIDNDTYAFLNTSLEPIEASTSILKREFIYIILATFIMSFVISYVLSKLISRPIIKINNNARELAKGNFDFKFETKENIKEIYELTETLNYLKKELEKTDELRKDLMANVSHDLKTPLTMIKAYAEMLRDLDNDKDKEKQNLNVIIDECDRLNNLVNDILELSKVQSNIEEITIEKVDLVKLIKDILKRYEVLKREENYKFIFDYNDILIVEVDKKKIEQVIYNLINNAIKYTGKDKKIEIKLKKQLKKIKLSVIDTGKGIDKKDIKYIWDKYYKVEKKYKRDIVGTGLGLNIVKNILEKHGYKYGVNSELNKGTEFYFYINL